jgi:hypothetical protein
MSVTLPQFKNIKAFLQENPEGGYEEWVEQYKSTRKRNKKNTEYTEGFEKWWCAFPATMNFHFRGRNFKGTRILRDDKNKTFKRYQEILKLENFTDELMLHCLKVEVEERMLATWNHKNPTYNDFQFMKATIAYLNSGKFRYYVSEELKNLSDQPFESESNSA